VWEQNGQKRILDKTLNLHDQLLLLIGTDSVTVEQLDDWTGSYKPHYLQMTLNTLETEGFVFHDKQAKIVSLSPSGAAKASEVAARSTDWLAKK
jgi:hypothetical protein